MHSKFDALRNIILPGAIYCLHTCCVYVMLLELCYVCTPTFIATIANMGHFKDRLSEALLLFTNLLCCW